MMTVKEGMDKLASVLGGSFCITIEAWQNKYDYYPEGSPLRVQRRVEYAVWDGALVFKGSTVEDVVLACLAHHSDKTQDADEALASFVCETAVAS